MEVTQRLRQIPRPVLIVSIVAVLALLALFLVGPLLTGSAEVVDPGSAEPAPPLVEAGGPAEVTSFGDAAAATGPLPRDPFAALVRPAGVPPTAAPPATAAAAPVSAAPPPTSPPAAATAGVVQAAAPQPGVVVQPAQPPAPPPPSPPPPPPPPPPSPPPSPAPQAVTLIRMFVDPEGFVRADLRVAGKPYAVRAGEAFDDGYRAEKLSGRCGTFSRFNDPFVLCRGETIAK